MIIPEIVPGKNADGLVLYTTQMLGLPYWRGTFGQTATQALLNYEASRFPDDYTNPDFKTQLGLRVHDCCGLVKGYLWSTCNNGQWSAPSYNSAQDADPRMLYDNAKVKGEINFDTFKKTAKKGTLVFDSGLGHVGVWTGSEIHEARGHAYGVVATKLTKSRGWKYWAECCFVAYAEPEPTPEPPAGMLLIDEPPMLRQGSKGKAVKVWQAIVGTDVDGEFGPKTADATKKLQKSAGIEVDAIVGPMTWTAGLNTL